MENKNIFEDVCVSEVNFANTYIAYKDAYPMYNQGRTHSGFIYTVEGTEKYNFKDKSLLAIPGSIIFIPKKEVYNIELNDEKSVAICIDFEFENSSNYRPFRVEFKDGIVIFNLFSDAEKIWKKKKIGYKFECISLIYKIIALTQKQYYKISHPKNYYKIKKAIDYLHEHYTDSNFRIDSLYAISDISPKYFNTLFSTHFNMTPKKYVSYLKINQAKEMLNSEKYSISDISQLLGYSDIYHFSKSFKKETLYSPTEYRKYKYNKTQ